jgi:predicted RNA-binding Zn-ribbon protein involved in translation (DUF1610 family)
MSVFIDRKYLLLISPKLKLFTERKTDLYNFRCPICGDSQKDKTKCRGYIFKRKDNYFYRCHNCGASHNFYNFLERVQPSLLKEYSVERFRNENPEPVETPIDFTDSKPVFKKHLKLKTVAELSDTHLAKKYCLDRKIPEETFHNLYYAPDFKKFVDDLGIEKKNLIENDKRLVIPFFDKDKNLIALQGRTLTNSSMRYITVKMSDENAKFFGIDKIDENKKIYVVEGPIDSLFLDNAIATADSNLVRAGDILDKKNIVLVFDNEPRNKEIVKVLDKAIEDHYNVVIWPEMIESKDINDMILEGFSVDEIKDIIEKNTFVNLRAKMEFINWKKV